MGALRDAASANPEKAQELLGQLKEKYDSLSPEEQKEALAKLQEFKDQIADLPDDKKEEIAALIREKTGV